MSRIKTASPRPNLDRLEQSRSYYNQLAGNLRGLESDLRWGLKDSDRIPAAWADIAAEPDCPCKEKLTLRVDEDVLRFFRATGQGYLTRMNKVLRTYMLARLAGVVQGAEGAVPQPTLEEEYLAQSGRYFELVARREAELTEGHDVAELNLEIKRMEPKLRWMEREMG